MEKENDILGNLWSSSRVLIGAIVIAGLVVLSQVRFHWGGESYYNYGWFVPILGAYLIVRRMADAPLPRAPEGNIRMLLFGMGALLILSLLPFQLLSEVNPFWRAPLILQAILLLAVGFIALAILGGGPTVRHFAFPLVFFLTMIPLPWRIETEIIQLLTRLVVEVTVWLLELVSYTAEVRGNTILVDGNAVGVDDACSGIRSLQVLGMVTLFLSDYFRMPPVRRLLLFGIAFVVIMAFNCLRSTTLTLIVVHFGYDAYDVMHDWVGIISFGGCIAALYGICEWIRPPDPAPADHASSTSPTAPIRLIAVAPGYAGPILWAALAAAVFLAKEGWFRLHEEQAQPEFTWTVQWPERQRMPYHFADIPDVITDILTYDFAERIQGILPAGQIIDMYYYGYTGENRMNAVTSYGHQPTVCMTAIGARLIEQYEPLLFEKDGLQILLHHFKFLMPGPEAAEMDVFWTVWERRNMNLDPHRMETISWANQFELMKRGRRDYARQVLLVGMMQSPRPEAARASLRSLFEEIIRIDHVEAPS